MHRRLAHTGLIRYHGVVNRLREIFQRINIEGTIEFDYPLAPLTTFEVGGPAAVYAEPSNVSDMQLLLQTALSEGIPYFVLGGGANILVSDKGVPALVIATSGFDSVEREGELVSFGTGLSMSRATEVAAEYGLGGIEFLYSMPGTVGGAVWMNARCYGGSISDSLVSVDYFDETGQAQVYTIQSRDFAYKRSPFQHRACVMLQAQFRLLPTDPKILHRRMQEYHADREAKGHFRAPSAGSVFKNNHDYGAPSGKLIDSLGLRGLRVGGAQISPEHANIIINTGTATAEDIRTLIESVRDSVQKRLGLELEREVLYVGDWNGKHEVV
ncbi:MAG: UDP-N-acetylmuramate dehydrogenase [Spirochaetaceae bacterium]|nr:MAG: UDP-N-acetylmuramate dehydrogenase [Spirochaetaceae bacterium]